MNQPREKYWFPAKRYGWGWSFPACWQGWLVFAGYLIAFALGVTFLQGRGRPAEYVAYVSAITLALLLVCWKKGEPPRWRWGGE